ncbi:MAG: hypothetical protein ACK4UN_00780, partial [Limisphaerales bacterium]
MRNPIINSAPKLIPQIKAAIPGVTKYTGELDLREDLATTMTTSKDELITIDKDYEQARLELRKRTKALRTATRNGRNYVMVARQSIKPSLSPRYTQLWDALGFSGSLRVPHRVSSLILQLTKVTNHLTANPDLATGDANLAASKAAGFETAIVNAQTSVNQQKSEVGRLLEARKAKTGEVHKLMRELFSTLTFKLTPLDARWVEFGFKKPGAKPIPEVPQNLSAILIGPTAVSMKWSSAPRANHYRVWKRVIDEDVELVPVGSPADLDFTL